MIPKGAVEAGESAADAALREFEEETGTRLTSLPFALGKVRQSGGKTVPCFASHTISGTIVIATVESVLPS